MVREYSNIFSNLFRLFFTISRISTNRSMYSIWNSDRWDKHSGPHQERKSATSCDNIVSIVMDCSISFQYTQHSRHKNGMAQMGIILFWNNRLLLVSCSRKRVMFKTPAFLRGFIFLLLALHKCTLGFA